MESDGVTVAYIGLLCPLISFVEVAAPWPPPYTFEGRQIVSPLLRDEAPKERDSYHHSGMSASAGLCFRCPLVTAR